MFKHTQTLNTACFYQDNVNHVFYSLTTGLCTMNVKNANSAQLKQKNPAYNTTLSL